MDGLRCLVFNMYSSVNRLSFSDPFQVTISSSPWGVDRSVKGKISNQRWAKQRSLLVAVVPHGEVQFRMWNCIAYGSPTRSTGWVHISSSCRLVGYKIGALGLAALIVDTSFGECGMTPKRKQRIKGPFWRRLWRFAFSLTIRAKRAIHRPPPIASWGDGDSSEGFGSIARPHDALRPNYACAATESRFDLNLKLLRYRHK